MTKRTVSAIFTIAFSMTGCAGFDSAEQFAQSALTDHQGAAIQTASVASTATASTPWQACNVYAPDTDAGILAKIKSESADVCQNDLKNLTQLYSQFKGQTCDRIEQIITYYKVPSPPRPGGALYHALLACGAGANETHAKPPAGTA